jgi:hypothetical protein
LIRDGPQQTTHQGNPPQPHVERYKPPLPVYLFLHIRDAKAIPIRPQELQAQIEEKTNPAFFKTDASYNNPSNRNLYLSHKMYGTPDELKSNIAWSNPMPVFDHRIPMPLTEELVLKMKNFPLIISLWDKTGISQNDTLVGYCKLNLSSGYSIMVNDQNHVTVNQILLKGVSPFNLYNQYFPITD